MNRQQYIDALQFCYKAETAGAMACEVAMLARKDLGEKKKLDLFRRVEAANTKRCLKALKREGLSHPTLAGSVYRAAHKIGLWFGEGDWSSFLDRFNATVHPHIFKRFLYDAQRSSNSSYVGIDLPLLEHLYQHELCLMRYVAEERQGHGDAAVAQLSLLLKGNEFFDPDSPDAPCSVINRAVYQ